jgi:hypothetical protein
MTQTIGNKTPRRPGFDLVTGWGSPQGSNFLAAIRAMLKNPLIRVPTPGTLAPWPGLRRDAMSPVGS